MGEKTPLNIQVIYGSTRTVRTSEPVAEWFRGLAGVRDDVDAGFVDLRELALPPFDGASPASGVLAPGVEDWAAIVGAADGFVVIAAEYNNGYPAALKNALDHLYSEWINKPIGFVGYGGAAGGSRSVQQLRQVAIELQMAPIRNTVVIPFYSNYFDDDGAFDGSSFEDSAAALLDQLTWWARALRSARAE